MIKIVKLFVIGTALMITSCATSMSPIEMNNNLPSLTKSRLVSQSEAEQITTSGKCRYLVRNRNYVAPIGFTAKDDLKNGARGIDEWVKLDGGNAYVLRSYQWITIDDNGSTQLHLDFDTLLCE